VSSTGKAKGGGGKKWNLPNFNQLSFGERGKKKKGRFPIRISLGKKKSSRAKKEGGNSAPSQFFFAGKKKKKHPTSTSNHACITPKGKKKKKKGVNREISLLIRRERGGKKKGKNKVCGPGKEGGDPAPSGNPGLRG